ncbi:GFA family protein [Roseateles sp. BYS180W]|uniref:GFA family protein n=1 Tax=Roseateles rivi TaxID=3299028 RepID=A0ABW7FU45_9BURK
MPTLTAQCHCGAAQLTLSTALRPPINCHCRLCRALSGAAFSTWLTVPLEHCTLPNPAAVRRYAASAHTTRWFCTQCGGHVYSQDQRLPDALGIPAGALPDAAVPPPSADYFTQHRAPWHHHQPAPGVAQFGGETGWEAVG